MTKNQFDIDDSLTVEFKLTRFRVNSREDRALARQFTLHLLQLTHERDRPYNETTFVNILRGIKHNLTDDQQSLVMDMYLNSSASYKEWCADKEERLDSKKSSETIGYGMSYVHGGSGYTGRLKVGTTGAPFGAESFQTDDDPRDGRKQWVKAVTAGGNGAGFSLGEIQGPKQPKGYDSVLPPEELRGMLPHQLLHLIDTAYSPGSFLRAMLTYYGQPMSIPVGNTSVGSRNINNPENRKTASQLDSVYRYMKRIDSHHIMTPERSTRFLVLCQDLLSKVQLKEPRNGNKRNREIYEERQREINSAKEEIRYELQDASSNSGIKADDMRKQIDRDKRRRFGNNSQPSPKAAARTQTQTHKANKVSLG